MGENSTSFPHPIYRQTVLQPAYDGASAHLFDPMMAANRAQVVMLREQELISSENARALLLAIKDVAVGGVAALPYQPGIEDLFFHVEKRVIERVGPDFGGNLQLARSRNDLGHALARLALRPLVGSLIEQMTAFRETVWQLAQKHLETVMPGYTHTQPAQPTTFAHYLAGVLTFLERDTERLQQAYRSVNQSPLGAAAFTGTGFNISRERTAELLGFEKIIASSQDSIGTSDHLIDIANALTGLAVNLSRMTHDLLFRATRESGALRIDDSFIQISSIMPQKRNPVVLEHLRARLSRLLGMAQTIVLQCHNIPYGDTQDIEDEIEPTVFGALATAADIVALYEQTMATLTLNKDHLLAEAGAGFTTVTELADTLVREAGLPFRSAHAVVSEVVLRLNHTAQPSLAITPKFLDDIGRELLGRPVELGEDALRGALDPVAFVAVRTTLGGAAASATAAVLEGQKEKVTADVYWLADQGAKVEQAQAVLDRRVEELVGGG